ncbi:uncharacterized protein ACMZJ9_016874 [Mantella aurantiaca]
MMTPQNILYILLTALTAGALKVTMKTSDISALRDQSVTIPCDLSDLDIIRAISVIWKRKFENGTENLVYTYIDDRVTTYRPESSMDLAGIRSGNAALRIPRVQFSDEGEYVCRVINTPNVDEGSATLEVSAIPSADVIPADPVIELGTEKTVMCDVHNFYPKDVSIRWVQYRKSSSDCELLDIWTCVKRVLENSDGTYNVSSHLTLNPKIEDSGNIYSCIVSHRSLQVELSSNVTLTVKEKEDNTGSVITAVMLTILVVGLLAFLSFLYFRLVKKAPPTLSEITGNEGLIDMNRTTLTCQIMDFRPNDIEISVCIRRSGKEMMTIYTWRSEDSLTPVRTSRGDGEEDIGLVDVEQGRPLMNGSAGHDDRPLWLEMESFITKKNLGKFNCQCSLHITPSYDLDNGAELSIHVKHPALTPSASKFRILNVVGVSPKLLSILGPEQAIHDEHVTLTCPINGFKPRALSITWLKRGANQQETELVTWNSGCQTTLNETYSHNLKENDHEDKSYSFISALTMKANLTEGEEVIYMCRTFHHATNHLKEEEMTMKVAAIPTLDPIVMSRDARVGEDLELSCKVHSFYPSFIQVKWYTEDDVELPSRTTDALVEHGKLYHVKSIYTYKVTAKDLGKKFRCEVQHSSLSKPKHVAWTLDSLLSPPTLGDIQCVPAQPEPGKPMTFSCTISNMCPGEPGIEWQSTKRELTKKHWKVDIHQDPESKMFCGTTELTITPDDGDHCSEISLDVSHCGKHFTKKTFINFTGLPVLSEISSDPIIPDYGRPVTLRCDVTGCNPGDISKVVWSETGQQRQVPGSGDVLSCYLIITPTARVYAKTITCSVTKTAMEAITKDTCMRLPERLPRLSDIIVRPARVTANQKATFKVIISGFSPKELKIKWCKAFGTFPQSDVTISELEIGSDSLYTCSSMLTYTPKNGEKICIRCEVTHSQSKIVREKQYNLDLSGDSDKAAAAPRTKPEKKFHIREITCAPDPPRVGEEVTLVAYVEECQVDSTEFTWCSGMFPVDGEIENKQDGSGCTSTITFTPKESDKDCTIKLEVFYNYQTVEEHYTLRLV